MKQKRVTIDESSTGPCSEEPSRTVQDDTNLYQGMHIPNHMVAPGQDGYRTPTAEDYPVQNGGFTTPNSARTPDGATTPSSLHHRLPHGRHHLNQSSSSLAHSILDKLHWRERIRHYTWTFYTITMATGGIANVLYTGKPSLRGPGS